MKNPSMRNQRGITLLELLIAMTIFLIALAAIMKALGSQSGGFRRGEDEMSILQNLRYGVDALEQEIRLAGANSASTQPTVVYAGSSALAINADIVSNTPGDISAVYIDPDAPDGEVSAWALASATTVPGSSPSFTYPLSDFVTSPAETIMFWFIADGNTTRTDDYLLMRQVNARPPETLMRNVLAPAVGNFFRYYYLNVPVSGDPTVDTLPTAWGSLTHSAAQHGVVPDTGALARIDLLRAIEVRYRVTNGRSGTDERIRSSTALLPMPNAGVKKLQTCGDFPIFGQVVSALWSPLLTPPAINVTWAASVDETAGESDVIRYVIWRRIGAAGSWGDPMASIPSGSPPYAFKDPDVVPATSYQYAVSAQDCTPSLSSKSTSVLVVVP